MSSFQLPISTEGLYVRTLILLLLKWSGRNDCLLPSSPIFGCHGNYRLKPLTRLTAITADHLDSCCVSCCNVHFHKLTLGEEREKKLLHEFGVHHASSTKCAINDRDFLSKVQINFYFNCLRGRATPYPPLPVFIFWLRSKSVAQSPFCSRCLVFGELFSTDFHQLFSSRIF